MSRTLAALLLTTLCAATASAAPAAIKAIEAAAKDACVNPINSDDLDALMSDLTDDAVYQSPGEPEIVGRAAVRARGSTYFSTTQTHGKKTSIGFTVNRAWAFERYHDESVDTDRKTGAVTRDTGKGINVCRRGSDGSWRVEVDGFSSDRAAGA